MHITSPEGNNNTYLEGISIDSYLYFMYETKRITYEKAETAILEHLLLRTSTIFKAFSFCIPCSLF